MFFRKDYAKPGPGVDRDEPEKTGLSRLGEIFSIECVTLVKLNLLFLLSCLPVVTVPAAVFAMNRVTRMMVLDQPVTLLYHYKMAFKREWGRAYAAFFAVAAPLVLSACGVWFYLSRAMAQPLLLLPFMLCSTVLLTVLLASTYFYALLATERSFRECLRLSLLLGGAAPPGSAGGAGGVWVPSVRRAGVSHQRDLPAADGIFRALPSGGVLCADGAEGAVNAHGYFAGGV